MSWPHRLLLLVGSLCLAALPAARSAEPVRSIVFEAGMDGVPEYRVPAVAVTGNGVLLAAAEARLRPASDGGASRVVLRRSTDGGATWSASTDVGEVPPDGSGRPVNPADAVADPGEPTRHNPVLLPAGEGVVHLLYGAEHRRVFHRVSRDDGATFGPPTEVTSALDRPGEPPDGRVCAPGPGHGLRLRSGRLLVPVSLSTTTGGPGQRPSAVTTLFSDDDGASWRAGEIVASDPGEAVAVELPDGRVALHLRHATPTPRRAVAFSPDGATGWSRPQPVAGLPGPDTGAGLIRLPGHPREAHATLVSTPADSSGPADPSGGRVGLAPRNLTVRLSADDGSTWPVARVLDTGMAGGSDLAVLPDGSLVCVHERGTAAGGMAGIVCARFDLDWLFGEDLRAGNDGFVDLFNGRDLSGWVNVNCAPETWTVAEGVLRCTGVPIGELRTTRMYQDFILELEWRHLQAGGNAGVFVWADALTAPGQPFIRGVEVQVLDGREAEGHTSDGDVFPIHGARLSPLNGRGGDRAFPVTRRMRPSPEWNHYRVTCLDGVLTHAVNGRVVTRGVGASPRKGYLCLESEGSPAEFRNIRLRELPAAVALAPVDIATPAEGFECLYDGVSLRGWHLAADAPAPWRVDDWNLVATGRPAAPPMRASGVRGDGELIVDWQWPRDGEQGDWRRLIALRGRTLDRLGVTSDAERPPGQWNRARIRVRGREVRATVNGVESAPASVDGLPPAGGLELHPAPSAARLANLFWRPLD